jgi:MYXO-CTERM domain-containing protein
VPATDDESPSDDDDDDDRDEDDDDDDDTTTDEEAELVTQPAGGCQVSATPTGAVGLLLAVFAVYRRRR